MTFEELGKILRSEREKKGFSIEDVSNKLKIGVRQLHGLEDGEAADLPHEAYVRGFIRSYAKFLGIGSAEVQNWLANLNTANSNENTKLEPELEESERNFSKGILLAILLFVVAAGGYFVWDFGLLNMMRPETRRIAQPSPPVTESPRVKDNDTVAPVTRNTARTSSSSSAEKSQDKTQGFAPESGSETSKGDKKGSIENLQQAQAITPQPAPAPPVINEFTRKEPLPASQDSAPPVPAQNVRQHKVVITATEECWIHSSADKTDTRQFSLRKGETFALTFEKKLELKLGNAGGVRIRYDGEDLPAPGHSGQVKNLVFPPPTIP